MEEDAKLKRWRETTEALLGSVVSQQYCQPYSISIVPEELRKQNEDASEPKVVSIGPRYKGRRDLLPMKEVKWRHIHICMSFLNQTQREATEILETCMRVMLEHDAAVRASYVEELKLDSFDLATTMLYNGCFLLELLISASHEQGIKLLKFKF
ncbi:UPF0481 protein [Spatholobus suberectus]|nr:UPF0481 protein [Spatholobus suberectus]